MERKKIQNEKEPEIVERLGKQRNYIAMRRNQEDEPENLERLSKQRNYAAKQ